MPSHRERTCIHIQDEVSIGLIHVYCSALKDIVKLESRGPVKINFGLYADYHWESDSRNEYINWPDFKAPAFPSIATLQIRDALLKAEIQNVEIGCIGGHGRTGTILACMASLQLDLTPVQAIDFVKSCYCPLAIETYSQEKFIEYFWRTFNV